MKHLALVLTCVLMPFTTTMASPSPKEISLAVTDDFILPSYLTFAEQAEAQAVAWNQECEPEYLKEVFHDTSDAWARVQHISFGPVNFLMRRDRLYHWPERRNSVNKGLAKILSTNDRADLSLDRLTNSSIAIQGFPALERLLFENRLNNSNACKLGKLITQNIARMARDIYIDWSDMRTEIGADKTEPLYFETVDEVANRLFTELLAGFQMISDQKILMPLGSDITKANGNRAESWRSGRSTLTIQKSVLALRDMAKPFLSFLVQEERELLEAQLQVLVAASANLPSSIKNAVNDQTGREQLEEFLAINRRTRDLIVSAGTEQLGLTVGFNSLDGD